MPASTPFPSRQQQVAVRVRGLVGMADGSTTETAAPATFEPTRRAAWAVGAAVVVAAVITGAWVLSSRPHSTAVSRGSAVRDAAVSPRSAAGSAGPASGPSSAPASPAEVVVDVAGKVRRPGVYRLPSGSRVDDAIRAAGGMVGSVDPASVNRAARVTDGEQIVVGVAPVPGASSGGASGSSGGGAVNLNTASLTDLQSLPGVGPVLAQHILDWRTQHGPFTAIDQLREVSGIGPAKFAALKNAVTL